MNTETEFTVPVSIENGPAMNEITDFVHSATGIPDNESITPILMILRRVLWYTEGETRVSILNNCFGNMSKLYFVVSGTARKKKQDTDTILLNGRQRKIIADFEIKKTSRQIRVAFSGLFPIIT
ncbi:MAG: hypothetical protein WCL23_02740 [Candidatus Moraniibacteriota bacterium]